MTHLDAWIVPVPKLDADERSRMLGLMESHFDGVTPAVFARDLDEKQWAILIKTDEGELAGFSTVQVVDTTIAGHDHQFLFSGDTIVAPAYWNRPLLAGSFGHLILKAIEEHGEDRLHWFLITKGYRTYRFLPLNFTSFHPAFDRPLPQETRVLLDHVARLKFGAKYDAERGLIRADDTKDRLRPELCVVPEGRASDAHVRFFLARNPDFAKGDELACITDLTKDNITPLGWRQIERAKPRWVD